MTVKVENTERMRHLASVSSENTHLPMVEQFHILFQHGLRLEDINWKVPNGGETELITRVPVVGDGVAHIPNS